VTDGWQGGQGPVLKGYLRHQPTIGRTTRKKIPGGFHKSGLLWRRDISFFQDGIVRLQTKIKDDLKEWEKLLGGSFD